MSRQAQSEARVELAAARREQRRPTPLTPREAVRDGGKDARLRRRSTLKRTTPKKRTAAISPASLAQREKAKLAACAVCEATPCDPAHLISRAQLSEGQDDPRAIIPLCRAHHDSFDRGRLSLLEYLEPHYRVELAFAVERFGLLSTLRRVTNEREYEQGAAACSDRPIEVGDVIRERQYNGQERRVEYVRPYHWIMARGIASRRVTTIAWRNLHRYEIVKLTAEEMERA